jgi:ABC-type Fe3+-hydroxamate transport system substrate-binding protein
MVKKVLIFDDNSKVIENQLKTIETISFTIVESESNVEEILEKKPDLIIINQDIAQNGIREIFHQPNPLPVILITDNGPEKQSFEAWSSPAHIVKQGDWDQLKLTVKEVLNFFD